MIGRGFAEFLIPQHHLVSKRASLRAKRRPTGHAFERSYLSKKLLPRLGRASEQDSPCGHIRDNAGLGSDLCRASDAQVTGHACLATNLDKVLQYR
jgi:hypothetical protein